MLKRGYNKYVYKDQESINAERDAGMSVAIGQISGTSMNRISGLNYVNKRSQAYPLENDAQVSDSYVQSLEQVNKTTGIQGVEATNPVQYANATATSRLEEGQKVNQQLNDIAAEFQGMSTYYDEGMGQQSYGLVGRTFDSYA